jgi:hypothetical protein
MTALRSLNFSSPFKNPPGPPVSKSLLRMPARAARFLKEFDLSWGRFNKKRFDQPPFNEAAVVILAVKGGKQL